MKKKHGKIKNKVQKETKNKIVFTKNAMFVNGLRVKGYSKSLKSAISKSFIE